MTEYPKGNKKEIQQYYDTDQWQIFNKTLEGYPVEIKTGLEVNFFNSSFELKDLNLSALSQIENLSENVTGFLGLQPAD